MAMIDYTRSVPQYNPEAASIVNILIKQVRIFQVTLKLWYTHFERFVAATNEYLTQLQLNAEVVHGKDSYLRIWLDPEIEDWDHGWLSANIDRGHVIFGSDFSQIVIDKYGFLVDFTSMESWDGGTQDHGGYFSNQPGTALGRYFGQGFSVWDPDHKRWGLDDDVADCDVVYPDEIRIYGDGRISMILCNDIEQFLNCSKKEEEENKEIEEDLEDDFEIPEFLR